MFRPKVSVCIPSYNCARFLSETIQSVLNQQFDDYEVLIIDDDSSDGTQELLNRFSEIDKRIIVKVNNVNLGMVANWNHCLAEARGEYIHFLCADDTLVSDQALETMVALLDSDPAISLVTSSRNFIDEKSEVIRNVSYFQDGLIADGTSIINRCLFLQKNIIGEPSSVMFRKKQASRGFDPRFRQLVDQEMWFYLLEQGRFAYIGDPLASWRIHSAQQTNRNVQEMVHIEEMFTLMDEFGDKPYVKIGTLTMKFLRYRQSYRIWKQYKKREITRQQALAKISAHCEPGDFLQLIPLYKICNPVWKLRCLFDDLTAGLTQTSQHKDVNKS